jgi:hypothetical protein
MPFLSPPPIGEVIAVGMGLVFSPILHIMLASISTGSCKKSYQVFCCKKPLILGPLSNPHFLVFFFQQYSQDPILL